jgi:signal transduction histidine kinase/ActR/RegA family two-component response regulator
VTPFRDLPIRRKLLLMTLASSAVALVLTDAGFLVWDIGQRRAEIEADGTLQGRLIADESAATISFNDPRAARETLEVLQIRPRVEMACLYDASPALFERYRRDDGFRCPSSPPVESRLGWNRFHLITPVVRDGERLGTLYVSRDLDDLWGRVQVGAATLAGLLLLAIAAAFTVAGRMQRAVTDPLLRLAETAKAVSGSRDYSLRAIPGSQDEIGVVVAAFNDMLDRITERTAELSRANNELQREVEERRRVEAERTAALDRERDANRLKDEFLATLSHELRTPLNAVLGWTRVLRNMRAEPAMQARALESIERNAQAQARLIEDLLEVSRIVTGKLRLQVREIDLAMIVDAAVDIVQPAATAKQLEVSVQVGVRPAMTAGDPDRLQQVVWNLLSNAVKFTAPGGRVAVRLERDGGYRLTVEDNGAGIDARFLPFVFEPFRQADGTASREHGGLGLGLAIAKQLVELHGGTIDARSAGKGTGAQFEVVLPSVIVPAHESPGRDRLMAARPPEAADPALLRNLRVLVVDDEEDARLLLQTALRQYGAEVSTASSVAEALAAIDRTAPAVILSDIGMPHEDGYAFMRRLRARPVSQGGAIPAVAVTAYASESDRSAAHAAGYETHISKPFDPAEIARLVARLASTAPGRRRS